MYVLSFVQAQFAAAINKALYERFKNVEAVAELALGTLLDPRYKKVAFRNSVSWAIAKLRACMENETGTSAMEAAEASSSEASVPKRARSVLWDTFDKEVNEKNKNSSKKEDATAVQVVKYFASEILPRSQDPMAWWKTIGKIEYPDLFKLAKRFLSVPGTSVPSERVFSSAGFIISQRRCCMADETAENLIFLRENMSKSR